MVGNNEVVLLDMEAGVEHFGRGVDNSVDLILMIVDPSFESLKLTKKIAAAGKLFMYHNHNLEFETFAAENLPNAAPNRRILEYLLEGFAPDEMGVTLDTYWVAAAGADVCDWISQMSDRIPCVHLKDMKVKNWQPVMAPVMEGNLNFSAIFHALEASNCKYMLVEQDDCYGESPFDCLKTSYENLANAGYR